MAEYTFNTVPVQAHPTGLTATQNEVESMLTLRRASVENALLFGGPVVRRALEQCPLKGDREHMIVDTKVTLLMPGWYPAIPGWHTDGVPRGAEGDPAGKGVPDLSRQGPHEDGPRFHTVVFGLDNPTRFLRRPMTLDLEHDRDRDLYAEVSRKVEAAVPRIDGPYVTFGQGVWQSWGWWNLHSASPAEGRGWRALIRVTESSVPPASEGFIRSQNQVYVPTVVGW